MQLAMRVVRMMAKRMFLVFDSEVSRAVRCDTSFTNSFEQCVTTHLIYTHHRESFSSAD
jgi:hypothetical protein